MYMGGKGWGEDASSSDQQVRVYVPPGPCALAFLNSFKIHVPVLRYLTKLPERD